MGKIKTHRASAKRFSVTGIGKVKINHAKRRHILTKKSTKMKRQLRKDGFACESNAVVIKKLIPYA